MLKKRTIKRPIVYIPIKPLFFLSLFILITAVTPSSSIAYCPSELQENLGSGSDRTNPPVICDLSRANLSTGNLYEEQTIPLGFLDFTLSYNSRDSFTGPLGKGWTHTYGTNLSIINSTSIALTQGDGRRVRYRTTDGVTYTPEESFGETSTIVRNSDNTFTLREKNGIIKSFAADGTLAAVTDRNGNTVTLSYTGQELTGITGPYGRVVTLTYTAGKITAIEDPLAGRHTITYAGDLLTSITNPESETTGYTYNGDERLETITDPSGGVTTYTYDAQGRLLSSTDPLGFTRSIQYVDTEYKALVTDRNGATTTYRYDRIINALTEKTDPLGNVTTHTYDLRGNLLTTTHPDGVTESYTYDSSDNLLTHTDRGGNTTTFTYEPTYNQVASITDGLGRTTALSYDIKGNLTAVTDPLGNVTAFTYDSRGRVTGRSDPLGSVTAFTYDIYGNSSTITDGLGNTTTIASDTLGNPLAVADANGNTTVYAYDSLNRLTSVTDPLRGTTAYSYGPACHSCGGTGGKVTSITDANGKVYAFSYDIKGRLIQETDPLGNVTAYAYDGNGNLIAKTDGNGNTLLYTYDGNNRLTSKNYPDGTQTTFTYDALGRIITAVNGTISYTLAYDPYGRPTTVADSNGRVVTYQYDTIGNRTQTTTPEGTTVRYGYDAANRLTHLLPEGSAPFTFTYDPTGRRTALAYPNGMTATYAYDTINRLTNLTHTTSTGLILNDIAYTHDNIGNRLTRRDPDKEFTYSYDTANRLLQSLPAILDPYGNVDGVKEETYTYDPVGNRLTGPKGNKTYAYDSANELMSYRRRAYEYDNNGSLTKKVRTLADGTIITWTYAYDYENRLIRATKDSDGTVVKTVTFQYDPFGRRVGKKLERTKNGIPITKEYTYLYDNEDIIGEYFTRTKGADITTRTATYLHGPGIDEPLAMEKDGIKYYYHADGLGSITHLTDANQAVVESYTYNAFGKPTRYGNTVRNRYTFTGREWDRETGLYYYRNRYYDPRIGRFISRDPIGFAGGDVNLYNYVGGNPVNWRDPWGLLKYNTDDTSRTGRLSGDTLTFAQCVQG